MAVDRQQIKNANVWILHFSNHIASCVKDYDIKFNLFPLYKLKEDITILCKMKEVYFIKPQLNWTL